MSFFGSSSKKDEKPKETVAVARTGKFVDGLSDLSLLLKKIIMKNKSIYNQLMTIKNNDYNHDRFLIINYNYLIFSSFSHVEQFKKKKKISIHNLNH
jgi:hypothetical protein